MPLDFKNLGVGIQLLDHTILDPSDHSARVLENKALEQVGDNRPISVDLRFITATNKDLTELISRGSFQEDLFYRVNVIPIHLPPLRGKKRIFRPWWYSSCKG
ncbi:MAG: sigma 54-interacting transcriptional regulator [Desulfohalobiaceae bacterium]